MALGEETPLVILPVEEQDVLRNKGTTYLGDGVSKVDFVFTFIQTDENDGKDDEEDESRNMKRATFCKNLEEKGLVLEPRIEEINSSQPSEYGTFYEDVENKMIFIKVHAPFRVLAKAAIKTKMKFPVQKSDIGESTTTKKAVCSPCCSVAGLFEISDPLTNAEERYFVDSFDDLKEKDKFIHTAKEDDFFTAVERHRLVYHLMKSTRFGDEDNEIGPDNLKHLGVFQDIYPLHDGPLVENKDDIMFPHHASLNDRQKLQLDWANQKRVFKYQPINAIRRYFGEATALYFAWLGFYTSYLVPAALVGLICFIYGVIATYSDNNVTNICTSAANATSSILMCPLCENGCSFYRLKTQCFYAKLSRFFDNGATVVFALFMSIWTTIFLEFWKRKQALLSFNWHTLDFEDEDELSRPEFNICMKKNKRPNPVTGEMEFFMPDRQKYGRLFAAVTIVFFFIAVLIATNAGIIILRSVLIIVLSGSDNHTIQKNAKMINSVTAAVLNLIAINVLKMIYTGVAERITKFENPRCESDYNDSYTTKMFWFNFVNTYGSIFYVAFIKKSHPPGRAEYIGRSVFELEGCSAQGCFVELTTQLIIIMVGQQFIGNFQEILLPYLKTWWNKRKHDKEQQSTSQSSKAQWVLDNHGQPYEKNTLFFQYLEIVLQYGFVSMFVAAFPLAPLFALINNLIEIRLDAINHIFFLRRPVPSQTEDIGVWYNILAILTKVSTFVNAFVIAFTSAWIPRTVYRYVYSPDLNYNGFTEFSLSYYPVNKLNGHVSSTTNETFCRYPGYYERDAPYGRSKTYWVILAARLVFVIAFQAFVFSVTQMIAYIIPDVPEDLEIAIKKEKYLAKKRQEEKLKGI